MVSYRPKKRFLTKKQHNLLKEFCESQEYNDDIFTIIKVLYEKRIIDEDLIFLLESRVALSDPGSVVNKIKFIIDFYNGCDVTLLAPFVKKLKSADRKKLFETYELSQIERYIYNTLLNAQKNNVRLSTKAILANLQKYKGVRMDSENIRRYYKHLISKMRRKLINKNNYLKRKNTEKEVNYAGNYGRN